MLSFLMSFLLGWSSGQVYVRNDNPKAVNAVFANSYTGAGAPFNEWVTIDVTSLGLPTNTKSVFLGGLLIISHGNYQGTCDLTFAARGYGDSISELNYVGQAVSAFAGGGERSTMSTYVPVIDGKFQVFLGKNTSVAYPAGCAYGVNLSIQAFVL